MYHLFVPVEEFLSNGGVLETDRAIYAKPSSAGASGYTQIGEYNTTLLNGMIIITALNRQFQFSPEISFVKVEATPIYK